MKRLCSFLAFLILLTLPICADATVATSTSRVKYNCNGSVNTFPFTFGVGAASEVQVILTSSAGTETTLAETTNYAVICTNNDCTSGGTVTTVATYATSNTITILRNVPLAQEADFTEGMPTLYESFETGLDKLTRIAQQQQEQLNRAVTAPKSDSSTNLVFPGQTARANKYLAFDAGGNPIASGGGPGSAEVPVSAYGATLIAAADAPAARAILDVPPVGSLMMYAGSSAPVGWLICDGAPVSRTGTYAALFAAIGTTFGAGDGSTTFNLPNFKGRSPIGVGIGGGGGTSGTGAITGGDALTNRARGAWTGAETHTQTEAEMPSHNHSASSTDSGHSHSIGNPTASPSIGYGIVQAAANSAYGSTYTGYANITTTIGYKGGGSAMDIMNPVLAVNFIIKY